MKSGSKGAVSLGVLILLAGMAFAQDREKQLGRVQGAADVLGEIMKAPDRGIPEEILGSAQCVAIVPSMLKAGFIFGGEYGHGVASCRTDKGWSAPAFFGLKGGTFGLQIGGQAVDLVMLIMDQRGMKNLLSSKFELGADASVAAGPVGRHAEGATDWKMRAQVLTYSRSRGIFAGLTLKGAVLQQDKNDTRTFYGRMVPYGTLLSGAMDPPESAQPLLTVLNQYASSTKKAARPGAKPKSQEAAENN
jgi:lipid-binding SYLF domain-containing protein